MKTKPALAKYLVNFSPRRVVSDAPKKTKSLFELATETITKSKKGKYTTASRDVDKIVYGTK